MNVIGILELLNFWIITFLGGCSLYLIVCSLADRLKILETKLFGINSNLIC